MPEWLINIGIIIGIIVAILSIPSLILPGLIYIKNKFKKIKIKKIIFYVSRLV
jgi:hypothetical protein